MCLHAQATVCLVCVCVSKKNTFHGKHPLDCVPFCVMIGMDTMNETLESNENDKLTKTLSVDRGRKRWVEESKKNETPDPMQSTKLFHVITWLREMVFTEAKLHLRTTKPIEMATEPNGR